MIQLAVMAIKKVRITFFVSVFIMAIGLYSFVDIPKQDMPDIVPPLTSIQIIAPGYSIDDVERFIVTPMEEAILSVDGVDYLSSISLNNIAIFNVVLDIDEPNPEPIFDRINREVSAVVLPDGVGEPTYSNLIVSPHAVFGVSSETLSRAELSASAEEFANRLGNVQSVAAVQVTGSSERIVYLDVNPEALRALNVTLQDVMMILNAGGVELPIGSLVSEEGQASVRIPANYASLDELRAIVVGMSPNGPVTLGSIAEVSLTESRDAIMYQENELPVVFVEVTFETGIDFTVLGEELNRVQDRFDVQYREVQISQMTFQPDTVNASLVQVYSSLALGVLLVFLVVFIGLGLRNALSVAFTLPLILLGTLASIYGLGFDLQRITIAGLIITIGIVVDNSIVIAESIQYHLDRGVSRFDAAVLSVKENSIPVLSSSLTTIAAFIPFMVIGGVAGVLIRSLPITVAIAIAISYVVAMLVMPAIGALFFIPKKTAQPASPESSATPRTKKALRWMIQQPVLLISLSLTLLAASLFVMTSRSELELFPVSDNTIVYIDYEYQDINDQEGAHAYATSIIDLLSGYPQIEYTAYSVGGDLPAFDARTQINTVPGEGRIFFRLDVPFSEIESYVTAFQTRLDADNSIQTQGSAMVHQLTMEFATSDADISLALTSYDLEILDENSLEILAAIERLDSVREVVIAQPQLVDTLTVELNRQAVQAARLTMAEVQQQIATNLNGAQFAIYDDNGETISVNVSYDYEDASALSSMLIRTSTNTFVPLTSLATIVTGQGEQLRQRQDGNYQTILDVYFQEDVIDIIENGRVTEEATSLLADSVTLSLGGQADIINETFSTLGIAAVVALALVFFILLVQFNSFQTPFIVLFSVPLSLLGSAFLVGILQTPISFTMLLGITSLIGIVVNMGILLLDYIEKERDQGVELLDACVAAVERRTRPILLSTITTLMGLIPLAINGGAMFTPMAVSLMGGLIASTFLTLVVIPSTYYLLERNKA
jgi:multidrug efflux pump subunit AcrB